MDVPWMESPERSSLGQVFVFRPGVLTKTWVQFLGQPYWLWTHFRERTVPCLGESCTVCPLPTKQYGYAPARAWLQQSERGGPVEPRWVLVIAEIGEKNQWLTDETLRGQVYEISRDKNPASPHRYQIMDKTVRHALPEEFDVRPILERIWGCRRPFGMSPASTDPGIIPFRRRAV